MIYNWLGRELKATYKAVSREAEWTVVSRGVLSVHFLPSTEHWFYIVSSPEYLENEKHLMFCSQTTCWEPLFYSRDANSRAGSSPLTRYIQPSEKIEKYKKLLLNEGDFMNEFKLHLTVNNFATSYNPKQLLWQQYQTTCNKKAS